MSSLVLAKFVWGSGFIDEATVSFPLIPTWNRFHPNPSLPPDPWPNTADAPPVYRLKVHQFQLHYGTDLVRTRFGFIPSGDDCPVYVEITNERPQTS